MSTVTQRQSVFYSGTFQLLRFVISQLSGDVQLVEEKEGADKRVNKLEFQLKKSIFVTILLLQLFHLICIDICSPSTCEVKLIFIYYVSGDNPNSIAYRFGIKISDCSFSTSVCQWLFLPKNAFAFSGLRTISFDSIHTGSCGFVGDHRTIKMFQSIRYTYLVLLGRNLNISFQGAQHSCQRDYYFHKRTQVQIQPLVILYRTLIYY